MTPSTYSPGGPTYRLPAASADEAPRVLLVEDNDADAELILGYLHEEPDHAGMTAERVVRLADALERLRRSPVSVVMLDLSLPDASGLEGVEALCSAAPAVPIVVMTGLADDRMAIAAVKAGAQDYLVKGQDGARVVRRAALHAIERHRLRREREALLSREREARAAAERAARVRDEVLGIVSHDLRNPLSTIVLSASALAQTSDPAAAEKARMIVRSGEWALRIIRDLLDVTAIEAGRLAIRREPMTVQAIIELVHSMFALQATSEGVALVTEVRDAPRWIDADVDRIVQALGNLVANAIRFTPRGGRVSLAVTGDGDGTVRFRVADTGAGIPPEQLPHLFDRFWQAQRSRRSGTGLGLAIARGVAEGHGGRIEVESEPGRGSAFTIVIPTAP